jgi:hypothetical protein
MPGKYSQACAPSAVKLNPPGRIGKRVSRCPREYTHIHMGVHEDIIEEEERRNSTDIDSFVSPIKWDAVDLNKK